MTPTLLVSSKTLAQGGSFSVTGVKNPEMCHGTEEPIFVTKNGYGDMVIMSMEAYERSQFMNTVYERLELSERDSKEEKRKDAFQALEEMRMKYGL